MTAKECQQFIDSYVEWLRKGISAEKVGKACELTTPFLDRHNDHLQVYALQNNGRMILSDDGYILADLRTSGLEINTPKRKALLEATLHGFGVRLKENQLVVEASPGDLGQRVHSLIQAMLAVNDMFMVAQPRVASFFWEDVRNFLENHDVRYSPRVKLSGRSGFDHAIDFLIPKSRKRPERLVQAINSPNRNTAISSVFSIEDIREARAGSNRLPMETASLDQFQAYAFLNDQDREVGGDIMEALESYHITPALWSQRQDYVEQLAE